MTGDPGEDSAKLTTQSPGHYQYYYQYYYQYALPVPNTPAFLSSTAPCGPKSVGTARSHPVSRFQEKYRFGFLATPTPSQSQFLTIPLVKNGPKTFKITQKHVFRRAFLKDYPEL